MKAKLSENDRKILYKIMINKDGNNERLLDKACEQLKKVGKPRASSVMCWYAMVELVRWYEQPQLIAFYDLNKTLCYICEEEKKRSVQMGRLYATIDFIMRNCKHSINICNRCYPQFIRIANRMVIKYGKNGLYKHIIFKLMLLKQYLPKDVTTIIMSILARDDIIEYKLTKSII